MSMNRERAVVEIGLEQEKLVKLVHWFRWEWCWLSGTSGGNKWFNSGCIFMVEWTVFDDWLDIGYKRKGMWYEKNGSNIFDYKLRWWWLRSSKFKRRSTQEHSLLHVKFEMPFKHSHRIVNCWVRSSHMSMEFWGEMWAGETNTGAVTVALTATRLDANVRGQHIDRK